MASTLPRADSHASKASTDGWLLVDEDGDAYADGRDSPPPSQDFADVERQVLSPVYLWDFATVRPDKFCAVPRLLLNRVRQRLRFDASLPEYVIRDVISVGSAVYLTAADEASANQLAGCCQDDELEPISCVDDAAVAASLEAALFRHAAAPVATTTDASAPRCVVILSSRPNLARAVETMVAAGLIVVVVYDHQLLKCTDPLVLGASLVVPVSELLNEVAVPFTPLDAVSVSVTAAYVVALRSKQLAAGGLVFANSAWSVAVNSAAVDRAIALSKQASGSARHAATAASTGVVTVVTSDSTKEFCMAIATMVANGAITTWQGVADAWNALWGRWKAPPNPPS
jgi:hypothetical protein